MKYYFKCLRFVVVAALMCSPFAGKSQILDYAADTSGALFSVAAFATGLPLYRVNGASEPASPCVAGGFSSNHFQTNTVLDTSKPAVEISLTANAGYYLNITGITSQLRRSSTGPDSVRYAYSTDGGITWPYQQITYVPYDGACGALVTTATWPVSFTVGAPQTLLFRIYGYDAADTAGVLQVENLAINGNVVLSDGCTQPSLLNASGITYYSATMNWAAVLGAASYNIRYRPLGDTVWLDTFTNITSINVAGLTCNTLYEYQIQTVCTGGMTSVWAGSSLFRTAICPCPVPTGLGDSAITATSAMVYWTAADWSASYNIRYKKIGDTTWMYSAITGTEKELSGLNCGTAYEFEVQNVCTDTGVYSDSVVFWTLSCACPTPSGLFTTALATNTATLNWPAVTGALHYTVRYRSVGTYPWTTDTTSLTHMNIAGLACGTQYEFQVGSYCSVTSSSSYSVSDTFATTSCPCPMPTTLAASSITTTTANLSWSSVVWAAFYNFRYRAVGATAWIVDSSNTTSKKVTGLTCGTVYEFQLQSVCGGLGLGSYTASTDFTTATCLPTSASSGAISVYFNQPVDNSVAIGANAGYLNHSMADTLIAYISRAKYSIDIAQYNYVQASSYSNIANALNTAHAAGITVRWIYDSTAANTGLNLLDSTISKLSSPKATGYGNMHNKFMVIDANSLNPNDAIVCTGSPEWTDTGLNYAYGNLIFIQDSGVAHAYDGEFNMMWGGTNSTPNTSVSKFGTAKTDLGRHQFGVAGHLVEVYFAPSDGTDAHIQASIGSANTDVYFSMYNFANSAEALDVNTVKTSGAYAAGIIDQASETGAAYSLLGTILGGNLKTYSGPYTNDNQYLIVDPSNYCSDPQLLTGSHNWTSASGNTNDENILILHNGTVANEYYQSFKANFNAMGGTLTTFVNCSAAHVNGPAMNILEDGNSLQVRPNPAGQTTYVTYKLSGNQRIAVSLYNMVGQEVVKIVQVAEQTPGSYSYPVEIQTPGVYFVRLSIGDMNFTRKVIKL